MPAILVVDDDAAVHDALHVLLDDAYRVRGARDGRAAVASVRAERPDLVLLDILLPGVDGLEVLKELRALAPALPVIMLTSVRTVQTTVAAMKLGAVDYVTKPFDVDELRRIVADALAKRAAAAAAPAHGSPPAHPPGPPRIVLVDRDLGRRATLAVLLRRFGRVDGVPDGSAAVGAGREAPGLCVIVGVERVDAELVRPTRALGHVGARYAFPLSVRGIAEQAGVSGSHLAHLFRAEAELRPRPGQMSAPDQRAAERILDRELRPEALYALVRSEFRRHLDRARLEAVVAWLETPLGRAITALEVAASEPAAAAALAEYARRLEAAPAPAARAELLERLDWVSGGGEGSVEIVAAIARSVAKAVAAVAPPERRLRPGQIERQVAEVKARVSAAVARQVLVSRLYTYRSLIGVPIAAVNIAAELSRDKLLSGAALVLTYCALAVIFPAATVGAWRYRLSRTSWRGIRFSFRGRIRSFVRIFLVGSILSALTLGLYTPFFQTRRWAYFAAHAHFGQRAFRFDGRGRDLFWPFVVAILLTLPMLGLYWFWFLARAGRYFWEHTTFDGARFRSTVTGRLLLNLWIGNVLLLLVTLGLGWPLVVVRGARLTAKTLTLVGPLDLAAIVQEPQAAPATGDALSSFFGLDVDLW